MLFEQTTIKDMLKLYSTLVGANTSPEEERRIFEQLKHAVDKIDPSFELGDSLTSYEAFLLATPATEGNVMVSLGCELEGYADLTIDYTPWDPVVPVDDTQQFDFDEPCVPVSLEPCVPCAIPEREEHTVEDFFQGEEISGLATEEFDDVSLFDTEQLPRKEQILTDVVD
jgi:hypothetical protein